MTFQIESPEHAEDTAFSFLGALEEGYFSDLVIKASSGKEVGVVLPFAPWPWDVFHQCSLSHVICSIHVP